MLKYADEFLGDRGFRKKETAKSTPRARFEALSVGISLALMENHDLKIMDSSWIDQDKFAKLTKSDAANNKSKLKERIKYVKDKLTGEL